jgi:hypothetical protein
VALAAAAETQIEGCFGEATQGAGARVDVVELDRQHVAVEGEKEQPHGHVPDQDVVET